MRYCNKRFLKSLKSINHNNYDILLVENSKTDEFFKELEKEKGIMVFKDNLKKVANLEKVVHSRNKILGYALEK